MGLAFAGVGCFEDLRALLRLASRSRQRERAPAGTQARIDHMSDGIGDRTAVRYRQRQGYKAFEAAKWEAKRGFGTASSDVIVRCVTDSAGYKAFETAVGQDGMIRISCVAEHLGKVTVRLRVGDPKERLSTAGNENRSRHFSDLYGHSDSTPIHRIVSRRRVAAQS